ncbi:hypothetical protein ACLOJK_006172 [Asimina triloba]
MGVQTLLLDWLRIQVNIIEQLTSMKKLITNKKKRNPGSDQLIRATPAGAGYSDSAAAIIIIRALFIHRRQRSALSIPQRIETGSVKQKSDVSVRMGSRFCERGETSIAFGLALHLLVMYSFCHYFLNKLEYGFSIIRLLLRRTEGLHYYVVCHENGPVGTVMVRRFDLTFLKSSNGSQL